MGRLGRVCTSRTLAIFILLLSFWNANAGASAPIAARRRKSLRFISYCWQHTTARGVFEMTLSSLAVDIVDSKPVFLHCCVFLDADRFVAVRFADRLGSF